MKLRPLKLFLLATAKGLIPARPCPKCSAEFKPFGDRIITSCADFMGRTVCPNCGSSFLFKELMRSKEENAANPEGPFHRPTESRIERRSAGDRVTFHFPSAGNWGIWLTFAVLWNGVTWLFIWLSFLTMPAMLFEPFPLILSALFAVVGIVFVYVAIRHRYTTSVLELSPDYVCLQRSTSWSKSSRCLRAVDVRLVSKATFYRINYQPVFGIEIDAGRRHIQFGSSLTDDEKNWLCWEIREYLRLHSPRATVSPAVEVLVRRP